MFHRSRIAALLAALVVSSLQTATAVAQPGPGPVTGRPHPGRAHAGRPDPVGHALARLRDDARRPVRVQRDPGGDVAMVRSTDGAAVVSAPAGTAHRPAAATRDYLARYGAAFGIDGTTSTAGALATLPSATGGSVVRAQQEVDGLPVFGGQVVVSLDHDGGLVSASGSTTSAVPVTPARVTLATARRTAVAVAAKAHRVAPSRLRAADGGEWFYDPTLLGTADPFGARPVWRFEVTDGSGIQELVLVDAARGDVALHYDDVEQLKRVVCDNRNDPSNPATVPDCTNPVRTETSGPAPSDQEEVNKAFDNIGEAQAFYQQVAHLDLGELIGTGSAGSRTLQSWVRWCDTSDPHCPMQNAFWDDRHMVLGEGYAGADDVVVHELTHGVIAHTSQLFYYHQSGAINESLADVMGEIADHRNGTDDDSAWTIGEDAPGGAVRSLRNPGLFGQAASIGKGFGSDSAETDNGDVHLNSGVGNKAAYLISQGGSLNGVTVHGIDAGDPTLTKTATLYADVIKRLPSGAQYVDLARTLQATCQELAAAGTVGFTTSDCASVNAAVAATRMTATAPGTRAPAAATCPRGTVPVTLFRDDDGVRGHTWNVGALWSHAPNAAKGIPAYASSGKTSWFGFDPDPGGYGDPRSSSLMSTTRLVLPRNQRSYLLFHHAYVFEWYPATNGHPASYPDGGRLQVDTLQRRRWTPSTARLSWVNGPNRTIVQGSHIAPWKGFGGDSFGYTASRVDLTPLAGKSVRPVWTVAGDASGSFLGWWVDDIEVYTCRSGVPTTPATVRAVGTGNDVTVRWTPPRWGGTGIVRYVVRRSDGAVQRLAAGARAASFPRSPRGRTVGFTVRAVSTAGAVGAPASVTVRRTALADGVSSTRVRAGGAVRVTGRLRVYRSSTGLSRRPVQVQRRAADGTWTTLRVRSTVRNGTVAVTLWPSSTAVYRLQFAGGVGLLGSTGRAVTVAVP